MKNNLCVVLFFVCFVFSLEGCTTYQAQIKPPAGLLFQSIKAPLTSDFNHVQNDQSLLKASHGQTYYFYEPLLTQINIAWDDADIALIASKRGISKIAYADYEYLNILGVFASFRINVYGYAEDSNPKQ